MKVEQARQFKELESENSVHIIPFPTFQNVRPPGYALPNPFYRKFFPFEER